MATASAANHTLCMTQCEQETNILHTAVMPMAVPGC